MLGFEKQISYWKLSNSGKLTSFWFIGLDPVYKNC
jgi:hypothetical protein